MKNCSCDNPVEIDEDEVEYNQMNLVGIVAEIDASLVQQSMFEQESLEALDSPGGEVEHNFYAVLFIQVHRHSAC